jgi:hypothetical protein
MTDYYSIKYYWWNIGDDGIEVLLFIKKFLRTYLNWIWLLLKYIYIIGIIDDVKYW